MEGTANAPILLMTPQTSSIDISTNVNTNNSSNSGGNAFDGGDLKVSLNSVFFANDAPDGSKSSNCDSNYNKPFILTAQTTEIAIGNSSNKVEIDVDMEPNTTTTKSIEKNEKTNSSNLTTPGKQSHSKHKHHRSKHSSQTTCPTYNRSKIKSSKRKRKRSTNTNVRDNNSNTNRNEKSVSPPNESNNESNNASSGSGSSSSSNLKLILTATLNVGGRRTGKGQTHSANVARKRLSHLSQISALCKCGAKLKAMTTHKAAKEMSSEFFECDECARHLKRSTNIFLFHCPNNNAPEHIEGYDLCCDCATQVK